MMMNTLITTLAQPALVTWLLKATALLVLALAVTSLLRRATAGTRHLVWLATLAGILALPAVSVWAPLRLAIPPGGLGMGAAPARNPAGRAAALTGAGRDSRTRRRSICAVDHQRARASCLQSRGDLSAVADPRPRDTDHRFSA